MFAHVDVNAFYASCERVFRPDLKGKPIIVLSNNDGCVIARSSEAKTLGIKMAQPYFKLSQQFLKQHNVHVFSSNYALYADMSSRVMDTIESLVPALEIYSIDEAFCDVSTLDNLMSFNALGQRIRRTVKQHTHLTVGVGIAQTKTLAKLANYAAKTWVKTGGVVDLTHRQRQLKLMSITPVNEVWGVGRALSARLHQLKIKTALDLARFNPTEAKKKFSIMLERTIRELNGESCLELDNIRAPRQHIICSRSFGSKVMDFNTLSEAISNYTASAAEKLRQDKQCCKHITVFIRTSPFSNGEAHYNNSLSEKISATCDTRKLLSIANALLKQMWIEGKVYHKAGVILNDFCGTQASQYDFFCDNESIIKNEKLMRVIDKINQNSSAKLFFASQGVHGQWHMKQDYLSPAYTTRISDLQTAKVK